MHWQSLLEITSLHAESDLFNLYEQPSVKLWYFFVEVARQAPWEWYPSIYPKSYIFKCNIFSLVSRSDTKIKDVSLSNNKVFALFRYHLLEGNPATKADLLWRAINEDGYSRVLRREKKCRKRMSENLTFHFVIKVSWSQKTSVTHSPNCHNEPQSCF